MDKPLASPRCPNCNQDIGFVNTLLAQMVVLGSVVFFGFFVYGGIYLALKAFLS